MGHYYDDEDKSGPEYEVGECEANVRKDLAALITTHPMGEGLGAMAIHLARTLDHADPMFRAALSRELRGVLNDLAGMAHNGADEDLDLDLSTPTNPGTTDADGND